MSGCTCKGWLGHHKCKHTDRFITPADRAKEKRQASKVGKAIAPKLSQNPAYADNATKIANDPELAKFLEQVS